MDSENSEYAIEAINKKLDEILELDKLLKILTAEIIKYLASAYSISAISLQGRINEIKSRNIDPYKYYVNNIDEIIEKFHLLVNPNPSNNEDNNN